LDTAVRNGDLKRVTEIRVSSSAKMFESMARQPDPNGWLPIHVAASQGYSGVITQLLSAGFDMTGARLPEDGRTPLHLASVQGHESALKVLLPHGAGGLLQRDRRGLMAIHAAVEAGYEAVVSLLVERGCPPEACDGKGRTVVHTAAACGEGGILMGLVFNGGGDALGLRDDKGPTPPLPL